MAATATVAVAVMVTAGIAGTGIYYGLGWIALLLAVALLIVGLFNAMLQLSEEGFYAMSFVLALFGAVTVRKNTRDMQRACRALSTRIPRRRSRSDGRRGRAASAAAVRGEGRRDGGGLRCRDREEAGAIFAQSF
jgi:hypothetical protein